MRKVILLLLFFYTHKMMMAQNIGIGTTTPHASAQLDINSNNKGILIPRMTDAEKNAIPSPAPGLMIFNTNTNSFQYYHTSSWVNISHSGIISGASNRVAKFNGPWGLTPGMLTDNGVGVSLNNTAAVANASAILDITSTSKGLLIPRMLSAERTAIASPSTGLLVFDNTTNSFWFYNGSAWAEINAGGGSSNWAVLGNNIYNNNSGNVGIGASTPFAKLTVNGDAVIATGLGIATTTPDLLTYKLDVNGSARIVNSLAINDPYPDYNLDVNGNAGIDNLGVGVAPDANYLLKAGGTAYLANLFVPGTASINGALNAGNNLTVVGNATVNGGDGLVRNSGGTQLRTKLYSGAISANLNANGSIGFAIGFSAFTSPPHISVAQVAEGTLAYDKLIYTVHDVTTTGAQVTIYNPTTQAATINGNFKAIIIGTDD